MSETQQPPINGSTLLAAGAAAAALLVPGLGHLILRRWSKALVYFLSVGTLAVVGIMMRGSIFSPGGSDVFDRLGFFAEVGSGVFYFLAHTINPAGSDISRAAGDYGTRLFATAGVLNLLCVLEAFHIGLGHEGEAHISI